MLQFELTQKNKNRKKGELHSVSTQNFTEQVRFISPRVKV